MYLFYIPLCAIQKRNVYIFVLNGALWDRVQVHCGICEFGQFVVSVMVTISCFIHIICNGVPVTNAVYDKLGYELSITSNMWGVGVGGSWEGGGVKLHIHISMRKLVLQSNAVRTIYFRFMEMYEKLPNLVNKLFSVRLRTTIRFACVWILLIVNW